MISRLVTRIALRSSTEKLYRREVWICNGCGFKDVYVEEAGEEPLDRMTHPCVNCTTDGDILHLLVSCRPTSKYRCSKEHPNRHGEFCLNDNGHRGPHFSMDYSWNKKGKEQIRAVTGRLIWVHVRESPGHRMASHEEYYWVAP